MINDVTPYFTVSDANELIAFMSKVFSTNLIKCDRYEDGTIQHARLRLGDSVIMLNEANSTYSANKSQMHVYLENVERTYNLALAEGARSIMSPMVRPHGDLMAGFEDPFGNTWWIAQRKV
jgi:PhnB protein